MSFFENYIVTGSMVTVSLEERGRYPSSDRPRRVTVLQLLEHIYNCKQKQKSAIRLSFHTFDRTGINARCFCGL